MSEHVQVIRRWQQTTVAPIILRIKRSSLVLQFCGLSGSRHRASQSAGFPPLCTRRQLCLALSPPVAIRRIHVFRCRNVPCRIVFVVFRTFVFASQSMPGAPPFLGLAPSCPVSQLRFVGASWSRFFMHRLIGLSAYACCDKPAETATGELLYRSKQENELETPQVKLQQQSASLIQLPARN